MSGPLYSGPATPGGPRGILVHVVFFVYNFAENGPQDLKMVYEGRVVKIVV
jgi:hypothetical protein